MSALRRLRNFWILWVTAMVLACFSNAVAQARYKVQDLGVQHPDNLGMAMGLNNYGWTLNMDATPGSFRHFHPLPGRARHGEDQHRRTQPRTRHAWRKEQFDQLERNQRPRGICRYVRNICSRSEWRRPLRFWHTRLLSSVSLAKRRHAALSRRWAGITGRPAPSITADKS